MFTSFKSCRNGAAVSTPNPTFNSPTACCRCSQSHHHLTPVSVSHQKVSCTTRHGSLQECDLQMYPKKILYQVSVCTLQKSIVVWLFAALCGVCTSPQTPLPPCRCDNTRDKHRPQKENPKGGFFLEFLKRNSLRLDQSENNFPTSTNKENSSA